MRRMPFPLPLVLLAACADEVVKPPLDVGERLGPGQVRAGAITRLDQLVGGPTAGGKIGDFKIYNSRVQFVIEAPGDSEGYNNLGGMPLAADLVREPGAPGESLLGEIFLGVGGRLPKLESMEVINDGQNGAPAVLRGHGRDVVISILEAFTGVTFPSIGATEIVEYSLAPDDDALKITLDVIPDEPLAADVYVGFVFGDGLRNLTPGEGFDVRAQSTPAPFMSAVGEKVSYAFFEKERDFLPVLPYAGMLFGSFGTGTAGAQGLLRLEFFLAVGGGDLAPLIARHARERGIPLVDLGGRIVDNTGAPVRGGRVHVETEEGDYVAFFRAGTDGRFAGKLPAGAYRLSALGEGNLPAGSVSADLNTGPQTNLTLAVGGAGILSMSATENGQPVPAKFVVQMVNATPDLPSSWGEKRGNFGAERIEMAHTGSATVRLPPGDYRVTASRGPEYDRVVETVTVVAGGSATFSAALTRVVDTDGWVSGDFHIHAQKSPDSNDSFELKVQSFAAEHLEVPVSTEHDYIADLRPTAAALGLQKHMHIVVGTEMSTNLGHINAFPLQPLPRLNAGAVNWFGKRMPTIFAELKENPGAPLLQVNHPLSISGGYWATVRLDPQTGLPDLPSDPNWSESFDIAEVLNGSGVANTVGNVMPRWFALLNRGKRVGAAGNSDSHSSKDSYVGLPRTYIASPVDDPARLTDAAIVDAVRGMRMTVSAGLFATVKVNFQGPGAVVSVPEGDVELDVKVQAPLWVGRMVKMDLVANGEVVATVEANDSRWKNDQVVRFAGTLKHTPSRDTWYVVRVWGEEGEPMAPVLQGRPFAFTNPIYVDRDGGGFAPLR